MLPLILNSNNVVDNGNNDTMIYKFPAGAVTFNRNVIAISSISLYFSWFNITSATTNSEYNNNSYEYVWYGSTGASTYTVTMPDGYYEISDINAYLQSVLVSNGHYLTDSSGNYVYYLQLEVNQTEYAVQFNSYPIPSSLPSGYSNPASMSFPSEDTTPQITILSTNNFGDVVGFDSGTYPSSTQTTDYSKLSDFTPQISNVNSIIVGCNLVKNIFALPTTLLYTFTPSGTSFGSLIQIEPKQLIWVEIHDGSYTNLQLNFYDQDLGRIVIRDSNVVVNLVITNQEKVFANVSNK